MLRLTAAAYPLEPATCIAAGCNRCSDSNGASHGTGQDRDQRQAAGLCAHQLTGGSGLPEGHVLRSQLCLGEPLLHDLPGAPGLRQDVQDHAGRSGHAPGV